MKKQGIALSNFDILDLLNNKANIVLYKNIHRARNIDEILGENKACVILFESKPKYGHWVCLFEVKPNELEFFNPYGGYPDDSLDFISKEYRKISNQWHTHLTRLLLNSNYDLYYNQYAFQRMGPSVKTCGRHCVVRLWCRSLPVENYYKMLKRISKSFKIDFDEIVTLLTTK